MSRPNIPEKANRVLNYILLALFLILLRVWYLGIFQYDTYLEIAKKPKQKIELITPSRGTIYDRDHIALAINKLQYDACILYEDLREIPRVKWIKKEGKKTKIYPRQDYIDSLCQLLSKELSQDAQEIKDIIYSLAALFPSTPMTLKKDLTESQYYRIKTLERTKKGIYAKKSAKRYYPQGAIASDLIGYIGQVSEKEYFYYQNTVKKLRKYLKEYEEGLPVFLPEGYHSAEDVKLKLNKLNENPLLLSDMTGKSGLELQFDKELKGHFGTTHYEVNNNGKYLRKLPGSCGAISGKQIHLNLSSKLQAHAEKLLAENEHLRDVRFETLAKDNHKIPNPWIKGGAIVALDPKTGQVLCMASYPRINGNDFIEKNNNSTRWLESSQFVANLWDGISSMEKEIFDFKSSKYEVKERKLTFETYLDMTLSPYCQVKKSIKKIPSIQEARKIIESVESLLDLSEQPYMYALIDTIFPKDPSTVFGTSNNEQNLIKDALNEHPQHAQSLLSIIKTSFQSISKNDDKLLFLDLLRLFSLSKNRFEEESFDFLSLQHHFEISQAYSVINNHLKPLAKEWFLENNFKIWRQDCFSQFLKEKRKEEREKKTYQRPYLTYLNQAKKDLFETFWNNYKWDLFLAFVFEKSSSSFEIQKHLLAIERHKDLIFTSSEKNPTLLLSLAKLQKHLKDYDDEAKLSFLKSLRSFKDLKDPLYGYYSQLQKKKFSQTLQDLARAFYPPRNFAFGRSYAYRQATPLGSIFKVVTGYEAIRQQTLKDPSKSLNPMTVIDETQARRKNSPQVLGFTNEGKKIHRRYKGGTLPRSHDRLGKIDYLLAMQRSSNIYFSLLAADVIEDPNDLVTASMNFGFGSRTGIDLPGEIAGILPQDLSKNKSGLYSFAIGQHSLIATPLQTAIMLSSLCNDGHILKPQIIHKTIGKEAKSLSWEDSSTGFLYENYLKSVGIYFPFFFETHKQDEEALTTRYKRQLLKKIYLPKHIKTYLLQSLHGVVSSVKGSARPQAIKYLRRNNKAFRNYVKLRHQLAGKTSTAEIMYNPTLDRECPPLLTKDIWFGGISFKEDDSKSKVPELVVVVYLRFGDYGKEAAPLASEIIHEYRNLCQSN